MRSGLMDSARVHVTACSDGSAANIPGDATDSAQRLHGGESMAELYFAIRQSMFWIVRVAGLVEWDCEHEVRAVDHHPAGSIERGQA